jgi:hypothetical protein
MVINPTPPDKVFIEGSIDFMLIDESGTPVK